MKSRFRVVNDLPYNAYQGTCAISGGYTPEERFIDTDFDIDYDTAVGRIFIREAVIKEWAELLGLVTTENHAAVVDANEKLQAKLAIAEKRAELAENLVEQLRLYDKGYGDLAS